MRIIGFGRMPCGRISRFRFRVFWLEKNAAGHCQTREENENTADNSDITDAQQQAKWNVLYDRGKIGSCIFRQIGLEELPRSEEESDFEKNSSLEQRLVCARGQIWNSTEALCMEVGRKDEVASWRVEDRVGCKRQIGRAHV